MGECYCWQRQNRLPGELPPSGNALNTYSWSEISLISQAGQASQYFSIGDEKTFTVSGYSQIARIIGFSHDTLASDGVSKAGITFEMETCYEGTTAVMNTLALTSGGWASSIMRSTGLPTYPFEAALTSVLLPVIKYTNGGTTTDSRFLFSEREIFGNNNNSPAGEGTQYAFYSSGGSKVKTKGGSSCSWWLRSTYSSYRFCQVSTSGTSSSGLANSLSGVVAGFCV